MMPIRNLCHVDSGCSDVVDLAVDNAGRDGDRHHSEPDVI